MKTRKIAVVTTFSKKGFEQYAEAMINSWIKNWPEDVDLWVYPDEPVPLPTARNLHCVSEPIKARDTFKQRGQANRAHIGYPDGEGYNYRYDAVKFCHKPFALWDFKNRHSEGYDGLVWLDADTITHATVDAAAVERMAPPRFDLQFLGRCYKYTECGYLYFNLNSLKAKSVLDQWVGYYIKRTFRFEREWHDSYLYDRARERVPGLLESDLTGHIPRRQGAGHPFVNSFLGLYMDHYKGDSRKVTRAPRKNDLFADHDTPYWKGNAHAKARHKPERP